LDAVNNPPNTITFCINGRPIILPAKLAISEPGLT
jgi:hypothetical protein